MADALKSKKPQPEKSPAPDTHAQTQPVEKKMTPSPQHHTTESYGKGSGDPERAGKG